MHADLYELTMAAGFWRERLIAPATFELFVRRLPPERGYLVAAGLEPALDYLEQLRFSDADRAWLRGQPMFANVPDEFFDRYLREFHFDGDVHAMAEGTPVFANEPILRVTAPLPAAQIVETSLLAIVSFATSVATKAARLVDAAGGRSIVEFGARRAHGLDAGLAAARAAYIGGCEATSLVEASQRFGIPVSGTMAHSWVQSFDDEREAFEAFGRTFPESAVYLLDTYDTFGAVRQLAAARLNPPMVRLDSGDIDALSRGVRERLDAAGLTRTRIFATGDLDEATIAALVAAGAPIDGFGVGTALSTVSDAPALAAVYKLVEVERRSGRTGVVKLSAGKHTWPGPKQVWRHPSFGGDTIAAADEAPRPGAIALLEPVMSNGRRIGTAPTLAELRTRSRDHVRALPAGVRRLRGPDEYPVTVSAQLEERREALSEQYAAS